MVLVHIIFLKINCMLLSWFTVASNGLKENVKESMTIVRRSLEFLGSHAEEIVRVSAS